MPAKGGNLGAAPTTLLAEESARSPGLQSAGELLSASDLAKALLNLAPNCTGVSLLGELAGVLNSSPIPTPGWSSDSAEMIPGPGLYIPQLLCKRLLVTEDDNRKQEGKVKTARDRLVVALMQTHSLARQGE